MKLGLDADATCVYSCLYADAAWVSHGHRTEKRMAKKRKPSKGFLVRLPDSCRRILNLLRAKNRRPITTEVQIALEKHAEAEGIPADKTQ